METRSEKVTFRSASGQSLAARLDRPAGTPRAYALFAHCFACAKDFFAASRISGALAERGIAVLRFDFTGLGGSEGDFANADFSSNVGDLIAAAAHLRETAEAPSILIGHSLGGAAVLASAAAIPESRAVVTVNAPSDPAHVLKLLGDARTALDDGKVAEVELGGRRFTIAPNFVKDLEAANLLEAVHGMRKAFLIFHAPRDQVVGIDNATRLFQAALHPKSFVALDGADHLVSRREDAVYVAEIVAAWAPRYLKDRRPTPALVEAPLEPGTVAVSETGEGRFAQTVRVGRHQLRADEPVAYGGKDSGPGPYDYLLAGLGACTAMTIRMYAERKGIPLERVAVRLRHDKIHAQDCADCKTREGRIDRIQREIEFLGDLDAETRARLLEIADKCPVHRTLHSEVLIVTEEVEPAGDQ
ncbi:MAG: alpha/beta fold hydrolase [Rhodospirillales bacterium]|nr:alpha/beta fold hydrolase [Rhodospirillales bacterium]